MSWTAQSSKHSGIPITHFWYRRRYKNLQIARQGCKWHNIPVIRHSIFLYKKTIVIGGTRLQVHKMVRSECDCIGVNREIVGGSQLFVLKSHYIRITSRPILLLYIVTIERCRSKTDIACIEGEWRTYRGSKYWITTINIRIRIHYKNRTIIIEQNREWGGFHGGFAFGSSTRHCATTAFQIVAVGNGARCISTNASLCFTRKCSRTITIWKRRWSMTNISYQSTCLTSTPRDIVSCIMGIRRYRSPIITVWNLCVPISDQTARIGSAGRIRTIRMRSCGNHTLIVAHAHCDCTGTLA